VPPRLELRLQQVVSVAMTLHRAPFFLALLLASRTLASTPAPAADAAHFVEVPAGEFTMGADRTRDPAAFDNERWSPAAGEGRVFVPAFHVAEKPVTVGEFSVFAREGKWPVDQRALAGAPNAPVTFVSWPDALAYCRWLETTLKTEASTPAPIGELLKAGWQVTLPTEAEWEKAARALDGRQYAWGTVSEWTRSPYQPYPYDASDDRDNLGVDALWVIRGGVLEDKGRAPRATARVGADPGARRAFIGFRVVISARHTGQS
jgi:formylglycine-generating enzyme required for sulfatase activity